MFLLKDVKVSAALCGTLFVLAACSSASFPEITEEDSSAISSEESGKILKEGKSLVGDDKNIAYDDENSVDPVTPAKTKPVIVADSENLDEEETLVDEDDEDVDFFGVPFDEDPNAKPAPKASKTAAAKPVKKPASQTAAPVPAQPVVPSVTYLADTFYFDNGSSALPSSSNGKIRAIVREAKKNNAFVRVMGFASSRTRNTDMASHKMANFKVSLARAEAVAAALRRAGMPANKILVEAMSDNRPAYLEVMPEGERLNRRTEVYISY